MLSPHSPKQNRLLAALPPEDYARLLPYLEFMPMPVGQTIYEPGAIITHSYFPTTSIVAPLYSVESGASVRLSIIGNEGLTGISSLLGGTSTPAGVVVQSAGSGYRMKTGVLKKEFDRQGKLQYLVLRFTQALMTQTAQNAVCNRHHNIEQQLCRFLLMNLDRLPGHELQMTHEQIAVMLGVRRESVTQAALKLQTIGAIQYSRGHIAVMDREELEDSVCECYSVVNDEYDRLLWNHSIVEPAQTFTKRDTNEELSPVS
ncbi:Crp/Fnr family transcriptional regulator [Nitrosospira multiformis]|uniref:cAMP-binding domain of CRP or a regulatory subunit of cAMP-dependent protein kinases n=1 Tax=Nitrosospira multiformis TaxID=1231 RepID=A0A1I7G5G1_9PROT|nr:Crp/Fnr family transcriptional regulator [Nitrosospira multiformis]SFU43663.1 cAMP-binding domain of CRP or a regulatory subunit of cAMP-dependent protein kinases [Nitrosospira multiformis]